MLARLLSNIGGPGGKIHRLYADTVCAVALYGAPVWAGDLVADKSQVVMATALRPAAYRIARCYCTVSHTATTVLAGTPPAGPVGSRAQALISACRRNKSKEVKITAGIRSRLRQANRQDTVAMWRQKLEDPRNTVGLCTVGAILPVLEQWLSIPWGGLIFYATQVITDHGCFGQYLCRIGKEPSSDCHHCDNHNDTAQHTLEFSL